ncbi:peptidoglycan editing factor PgeF [Marinobacter halodurans]|uniref:Purine nucleoside phosphorylase n=1 Tax=Marinobacter halodurans TaxID=2528979 RepID=A0ABY1ZII5_9GAMM|nr:peptidoglycan editing factor PgeF [Marinobacter halodurans]
MPLIVPDWPLPENVRAAVSTRVGGLSVPPFDTLNLGDHVGDAVSAVTANRARLADALEVRPESIGWIRQVHGTGVAHLPADAGHEADASWTREPGVACAVLTADCLPVLFCADDGSQVAAAHAGWRGLASGVLEATLATFPAIAGVRVWLGPAIGPDAFEVGSDVLQAFVKDDRTAASAFRDAPGRPGHYLADLYTLARHRLCRAGVRAERIYGGGFCTFSDPGRFYSYRRDGETGRMASLIWRL